MIKIIKIGPSRHKRGQIDTSFLSTYSKSSTDSLIGLLNESSPPVRTAAATILGERRSEEAIQALCLGLFKEKALYSKIAISEALSHIGIRSIPELLKLVGKIGNNQHKELPTEIFKKWSYPLPRDIAIRTIVKMDKSALSILRDTLTDVYVPLTQNNVVTTSGTNLGYQGSYANYYIANKVVLVPNYNDPNDAVANNIIQSLYPSRTVVGIDVRNLYQNGGMIHCVTQQQPAATTATGLDNSLKNHENQVGQNYPNPVTSFTTLPFTLSHTAEVQIELYNSLGQLLAITPAKNLLQGHQTIQLDCREFPNGLYSYVVKVDGSSCGTRRLIVRK